MCVCACMCVSLCVCMCMCVHIEGLVGPEDSCCVSQRCVVKLSLFSESAHMIFHKGSGLKKPPHVLLSGDVPTV